MILSFGGELGSLQANHNKLAQNPFRWLEKWIWIYKIRNTILKKLLFTKNFHQNVCRNQLQNSRLSDFITRQFQIYWIIIFLEVTPINMDLVKERGINIFIYTILNNRQPSKLSKHIKRRLGIWFGHALLACVALLVLVSCSSNIQEIKPPDTNPLTPTIDNVITLHYNERPPYLVTTETGVGGLTGDPATIVFEKSNIPYKWEQTPSKRQIYLLEQNRSRDCAVGWFRNKERERFAKYTLPIYQDKPQIALARADNDNLPLDTTVDKIFSNPKLNLLVKDGYSYGDFLDGKIKEYNPIRTVTTVENNEMLKMVYARHADYFFIAPEEANGLIISSEFDLQNFKFVHFRDIPSGEQRYILCSEQVEDSIIERLNEAIRQYVSLPS